jgi:hypothetical protein
VFVTQPQMMAGMKVAFFKGPDNITVELIEEQA